MAQGDGFAFNNFKEQVLIGAMNLASAGDQIKVALIGPGWTQTIDGEVTYATVSGSELSGTGYTAGGEILGAQTVVQDDANDRAAFDGNDVTWTAIDAGTPATAFMYSVTAANQGMMYWELTTATNGGDYTLQWGALGIMLLN